MISVLVNAVRAYAQYRTREVSRGAESARLAALLLQKYGEGLAAAASVLLEEGNVAANAVTHALEEEIQRIDPASRQHTQERWAARPADLTFNLPPTKTGDERISAALEIAVQYGTMDGAHKKAWVIDQIVRALTADDYETWVRAACTGGDGPDTYEWDEGVPP